MNTTDSVEVILTHEYTDFDALSSLVAASLLYPNARPVLPRRMNRNVRKFLTRFKANFAFLTANDFPQRLAGPNSQRLPVDHAILVDTGSALMVKGMGAHTAYTVIDHHTVQNEYPEGWDVWCEPVGANTTLLVEKIIEKNIPISPLQATLFAIGIHHDTGSFTHNITTHRDICCLAWLMEPERGVNIDDISLYLAYPLGKGQRKLFQRLIENSELTEINGNRIVITQVEAKGQSDEFSTLASRIRDFFESDAIFLLFEKQDLIQIVARSTTDNINVGAVTRAFGGGGHLQAAAAGARTQDMHEVYTQLVPLIHQHSKPPIAVRDLMTIEAPLILSSDQTMAEAAQLMAAHCEVECPVIAPSSKPKDMLLGVLNRREVDQAMNYQLGAQPIRRFMRAGLETVASTDSLDALRRVMAGNRWFRVPIVDKIDGNAKIVGTVTQGDLIAAWGASVIDQQPPMLDWQLNYKLPTAAHHLLKLIGETASAHGLTGYIVGGFVRDLLLDTANRGQGAEEKAGFSDFDIVIEGHAIHFAEALQSLYGGRVVSHQRFGTATWHLNDPHEPVEMETLCHALKMTPNEMRNLPNHLDLITARTEIYTSPAALPTVEPSPIKLDLRRRDFALNTLAIHLHPDQWGTLFDPYDGLDDLHKRRIQTLHPLSFIDDPTRIFRAVRYEQRFHFQIEYRTLDYLQDALSFIDLLTPARIRHEFERIFHEVQPERALSRLDEVGVLKQIDPQLIAPAKISATFALLRRASDPRKRARSNGDDALPVIDQPLPLLYWGLWAFYFPSAADDRLIERLGLPKEIQRLITDMRAAQQGAAALTLSTPSPSQAAALFDPIEPNVLGLFQIGCEDKPIQRVVRQYLTEWRGIQPVLNGTDLQQLKIPAGPIYKEILQKLRNERLEDRLNSREEEIEFVTQYLSAQYPPTA